MQYYIVRPKHGLILDTNLHWKKAQECSGSGPGMALGLEMADALVVASWASFDGVSAVPYPEETACSYFEKESGHPFLLRKKDFCHADFVDAVTVGTYPEFLLRKPLNKAEKKMLFGKYVRDSGKVCRLPARDKSSAAPIKKKDLRGDNEYKGVENVFYIVNTKKGLFLTTSLSWVGIDAVKSNKKLRTQLFSIRDDISIAQTLAQWITAPGETVAPCTPATLKRKYRCILPNPTTDSLTDGIRSRKYPSFLARKPENSREVAAFQLALREGFAHLEERTLLAVGKTPEEEMGSSMCMCEQETELLDGMNDSELLPSPAVPEDEELLSGRIPARENEQFGFKCRCDSVTESSELIRDFLECAVAFGKMLSDAPALAAQKALDLDIVQRQLVDLDHVAEFYSLNASDGYRLNKARKEFLQKRRVIKNELFVLELVNNCFSAGITPRKISQFINSVMGLDNRSYSTRVMTIEEIRNLIRNPKTQELILGRAEEEKKAEKKE